MIPHPKPKAALIPTLHKHTFIKYFTFVFSTHCGTLGVWDVIVSVWQIYKHVQYLSILFKKK